MAISEEVCVQVFKLLNELRETENTFSKNMNEAHELIFKLLQKRRISANDGLWGTALTLLNSLKSDTDFWSFAFSSFNHVDDFNNFNYEDKCNLVFCCLNSIRQEMKNPSLHTSIAKRFEYCIMFVELSARLTELVLAAHQLTPTEKNTLLSYFIQPVQRLPRISMLISEIEKKILSDELSIKNAAYEPGGIIYIAKSLNYKMLACLKRMNLGNIALPDSMQWLLTRAKNAQDALPFLKTTVQDTFINESILADQINYTNEELIARILYAEDDNGLDVSMCEENDVDPIYEFFNSLQPTVLPVDNESVAVELGVAEFTVDFNFDSDSDMDLNEPTDAPNFSSDAESEQPIEQNISFLPIAANLLPGDQSNLSPKPDSNTEISPVYDTVLSILRFAGEIDVSLMFTLAGVLVGSFILPGLGSILGGALGAGFALFCVGGERLAFGEGLMFDYALAALGVLAFGASLGVLCAGTIFMTFPAIGIGALIGGFIGTVVLATTLLFKHIAKGQPEPSETPAPSLGL